MISVCSFLLETCPLDGQGCPGVTKVVVDLRKFVLPSFCGYLIMETELDFGDHSEKIRVERDPALCELLNGDTGNLWGWPNFGNKSCVSSAHRQPLGLAKLWEQILCL
jgi:hypothetical protein